MGLLGHQNPVSLAKMLTAGMARYPVVIGIRYLVSSLNMFPGKLIFVDGNNIHNRVKFVLKISWRLSYNL